LAGSKGETLAYTYIEEQFREIGLEPKGEDGYLQPFEFSVGKKLTGDPLLTVSGKSFAPFNDFYPLPISGNATLSGVPVVFAGYGITAPELNYNDYDSSGDMTGKIVVIKMGYEGGFAPHSDFEAYSGIARKVENAKNHGAAGVLIANFDEGLEDPGHDYTRNVHTQDIPVLFISDDVYTALGQMENPLASLSVNFEKIQRTGHNVIGYIDNHANSTIVIGGHYDHLGWGEYGSLYTGPPAIHNGADDNASGTSMVMELARYLADGKDKNHNYLFIAFSGEELGLFGSKYYVDHPTIDLSTVAAMLNFDMVGRYNEDKGIIEIGGTGTSPYWTDFLDTHSSKVFKIKRSESGIGPSDHTSFYLKDIPVLFFFTGTHEDYHKPTDDYDKINYDGMYAIYNYAKELLDELDKQPSIEFTKTKEEENQNAPRFTVTLGVVPDYMFDGEGMRIDGVREGKPADKAGMQKGDIVIQMGDFKVTDMMSYMEALSKYKKGDTVIVKAKRGEDILDFEITF